MGIKAHEVRLLRQCAYCKGIGLRPDMLPMPPRQYAHGKCYIERHGLESLLSTYTWEQTGGLRLNDVGPEVMKVLLSRVP